jgi:hypothetical protein
MQKIISNLHEGLLVFILLLTTPTPGDAQVAVYN